MSKMNEIVKAYSEGLIDQNEANKQLEAIGSPICIDESKCVISEEEKKETVTDGTPEGTTGWGFVNHGVGKPEKMYVKNGKFEYDTGFDLKTNVIMTISGIKFRVDRDKLVAY